MLLADFCNRLTTREPVDRVIPERGAFASPTAATTRAGARRQLRRQPAFRRPSPRWSALDGAVPSFGPFDHSPRRLYISVELESKATARKRCHLAAAFSAVCDVGERPLTLSVAPRARLGPWTRLRSKHRGSLPPLPRQRGRLVRPRTPSIDRCSQRVALSRDDLVGARHRCLGFAAEDPASGALSLPRSSRPELLDPTSVPKALHPRSRRAERRLSTSATNCDPRAHPTDRPNPAHRARGRPRAQLFFEPPPFDGRTDRGWPCFQAQPIEMSRARGQLLGDPPSERLAPPAAIARGGSFTPTRSARTPHVTGSWRRRLE
jgi:hypothetical protein